MNSRTSDLILDIDEGQLVHDDCLALLERVAASSQLKRAARLRDFLLYVGKESLKHSARELHEQEIGSVVFGRTEGYDTSQDNIVRVNATELRKRIEAYFSTEGAAETLIFELPRGGYRLVFRRRVFESKEEIPMPEPVVAEEPAPVSTEPAVEHLAPQAESRPRATLLISLGVLVVLLGIVCAVLFEQNVSLRKGLYHWENKPALSSFWPGFLDSQPATDVILADTSFALMEDITKRPIPLNDYLSRSYMSQIQSRDLSKDRQSDLTLIMTRNNGSVGDFRVAERILSLEPNSTRLHLQFARDYTPESIKRDNVILIGSRKSNPWVDLFKDQLNFTVEYDPDHYQSSVRNKAPQAGEQAVYALPENDQNSLTGYSIVAFLPNPSHTADALILAGTNSESTDAAGEFLTSEEALAKFQRKLNVKKFPYFEVLLKTTHLNSTSFSAQMIAYRTYPDQR